MQGARFDTKSMLMAESNPRELFAEVPVIHLDPCATDKKHYDHGIYECPLYVVLCVLAERASCLRRMMIVVVVVVIACC
jgi:hypothetical protein